MINYYCSMYFAYKSLLTSAAFYVLDQHDSETLNKLPRIIQTESGRAELGIHMSDSMFHFILFGGDDKTVQYSCQFWRQKAPML